MADGFYSGDKPNPNLHEFCAAHLRTRPYTPSRDTYNTPPFDRPIESTKATKIYNVHSYHLGKKPHDAIREYIKHYTQPSDLVLDPFCGSGSTALAALLEDRKAIAIDRSPAATFITKNYCSGISIQGLTKALAELRSRVQEEIEWLYDTRCDGCNGKATTVFTVYSQTFKCPRCLEKVALFDCERVEGKTAKGKPITVNVCPNCFKKGAEEVIRSQSQKFGYIPVASTTLCKGKCKPARRFRTHTDSDVSKRRSFEEHDLKKLREIDNRPIPHRIPSGYDMTGFSRYQRDALFYYDVREVADLFTKRNLWAIAAISEAIAQLSDHSAAAALQFALNAIILNCSRMYRYRENLKGGYQQGIYYMAQEAQVINVWRAFEDKISDLISAAPSLPDHGHLLVSTQNAADLGEIPDNAIDYIFTDPPYGDRVQYGELNFVWEAWLGLDTSWHQDEAIVNEVRGKSEEDWANLMRKAMRECHRVLKPGRWLSLCYHDTSEGTWELVQDIMAESGFIADKSGETLFIDTGQKSYNQLTADKVTKRDLVINFRKAKSDEVSAGTEITGEEDPEAFGEKLRVLIADFLLATPGVSKDRIYDHVVSRMVRAGVMQAHNFEEYLQQVAEPITEPVKKNLFEDKDPDLFGTHETVRWYLKSTQLDVVDSAESAKEDRAAEKLKRFIETKIQASPWVDGIHYSDLFEQFISAVHDKPRRPMVEWLLDYFYKTDSGTYRLPANAEEARLKTEGRSKGTSRRIKRYLAFLEQGVAIPTGEQQSDATLADWIRHAKIAGMYEAGKTLFERGGLRLDHLDEEAAVNVEEDYQVCVRMLNRQGKG